ncbi:hypothetical protein EAH_00065640 [Eimeria acervulina]|uniref:Uncharacterized protein n=1 Tax=Eimeria acervulina TaxID=5801 RepID=U6GSL1_EIMAC|nr:hypothetical protein EAH_00065640 [Eimeria acervulina]CDI82273.1 hypothetical protein EAH_00065640 [Eimeria acervulina]
MPPSVLDAQRLAHHLFETKLTSSHLHSRDGVLEENESAPHLSRTTSSFQDPLARRPRSTPRSRSALVLLILAFPIIMAIMLFSICKVSLTRRQTSRMIPRRLAYGGDDMDDSDLFSLMEECLAMEEEVGLVPPEPNSSPSSDMSTGIVDLDAVLSATAAVHAPTPVGPHSAWDTGAAAPDSWDDILAAINSQSESQHQEPSELQQTASQGAAFGGEGLSGALSALDPDAWDDMLSTINSQPESQHLKPSELQHMASQGAAFGGEGPSGALSAVDPDAWDDIISLALSTQYE